MSDILFGADRLDEYKDLFQNKRIGLITTPTGVLSDLSCTIDAFDRMFDLEAMFSPEHGVRGDHQDGASVDFYIDQKTRKPVYSIYGEKREPSISELEDLDILVYDIQDVGSRYYTFLYSMTNSMKKAKERGIPFVVLDRPNPIGGLNPEGSQLEEKNRTFIGLYDYPQRFSLTPGEFAKMVNTEQKIGADLFVVPMKGWTRDMFYCELGKPWINPSPNIASYDSIVLYNGTCLFEGTNLSEGRGTTRPFELIGAPWIDGEKYADKLNSYHLDGVKFRQASFIPMFHKHSGKVCNGVQVHVIDYKKVKPLQLGLTMLKEAIEIGGENFQFTAPRHEIGDYTIDLLFGSDSIRKCFDMDEIRYKMERYSKEYSERYSSYWIYPER